MIRWKTKRDGRRAADAAGQRDGRGQRGPVEGDLQVGGALLRPQPVREPVAGDEQDQVVGEDAERRPPRAASKGRGSRSSGRPHGRPATRPTAGEPAEPHEPAETLLRAPARAGSATTSPATSFTPASTRRTAAGHPAGVSRRRVPAPRRRARLAGDRRRPRLRTRRVELLDERQQQRRVDRLLEHAARAELARRRRCRTGSRPWSSGRTAARCCPSAFSSRANVDARSRSPPSSGRR